MSDITGLGVLVRDLTASPFKVQRNADKAVRANAKGVESKWRQEAAFLRHAPLYPASITHDVRWRGAAIEAEIGPDKELPQGALGNLIEFGTAKNPPHANGSTALNAQEESFERDIAGTVDL